MWDSLGRPWQVCLEQSWEAFSHGSIPIGAAIVNPQGEVVAAGRNRTRETSALQGQISNSQIAHAEINALAHHAQGGLGYAIYSALEPCPMCAGAIYMSGIRNIYFAARDGFAGGTDIYGLTPYLTMKPMSIFGPVPELEEAICALQVVFFMNEGHRKLDHLLNEWNRLTPRSVELAKTFVENGELVQAVSECWPARRVMELLWTRLGNKGRDHHSFSSTSPMKADIS